MHIYQNLNFTEYTAFVVLLGKDFTVLKNTLFSKAVGVVTLYAFVSAVLPQPAHATRRLAPISFDEMYSLAQNGEVEALRASVFRGMNIDTVNYAGDTGLCIAAKRHDVYTYNSFRASGANPRHPCTQNISDYEEFLERSRVVGLSGTSREALSAMGNKETYKVNPAVWWWIGGALLTGGVLWLVLGHHHGKSHKHSGSSAKSYYSLGANAFSKGNALKQTSGKTENNATLSYSNTSLENVDSIDLLKNVLVDTDHIKSLLYAQKGGEYINESSTSLNAGVGAIAMNAVDNAIINNNGYIRLDSYNASVGMVASESSKAFNLGTGIIAKVPYANGINMNFSGYTDNAAIIGMYADTNSQLTNYGDIYGTAIKSAKKEETEQTENSDQSENDKTKETPTTSLIGTMVGMEAMILNVGSDLKNNTITVTNSQNGKIYLSAGDSGTSTGTVSVGLVGMGSYLDNAFLNSSNILSRAEKVILSNEGTINLSYSGNYTALSSSALRKGLGGIVGIRADANTEATNTGLINIILYDEFKNEGVDVSAGMQSVHGGDIINNGQIKIYTPSDNERINYGMLAVEGSGTNSSLYANINPLLKNTENINIEVSNSYGMASFVGGKVINEGNITLGNAGTSATASGTSTRFNKNIAMYGYGSTKQSSLANTGTIDIYSYKSIAMQNDYAGGTDITNDGIINIYESAVDSYVFGGAYSNLYNNNTINYYATSSKQDSAASNGETYNPFKNYKISIGISVVSTKTRSIKEDTVDYKSSTTEGIYNNAGAVINMFGSSFVAAMSVETNDNAESTQAKAYNNGTINIKDRESKNATNAVGMYVDSGALNNAGIFNNEIIVTDSRFSAAMASNSIKNADVVNNGSITTQKDYSLGIYVSDISNVLNNGNIYINGSDSVGIQAGGNSSAESTNTSSVYPILNNNTDGVISVGSAENYVENSFGIYVGESGIGTGAAMAAQTENNGVIDLYTKNAGAAVYSTGNKAKIENKYLINVFGNDAYGIYSGNTATIINDETGIINVGQKDNPVAHSYAVYNTGDSTITNKGVINLYNKEESYAVYDTGNSDIKNEGDINLFNEKATAFYTERGKVTNTSVINLNNDYNTAIEINTAAASDNAQAINDTNGIINVGSAEKSVSNSNAFKAAATIAETSGEIINKGTINLYNENNSHAVWAGGNVSVRNTETGSINSYNDNSVAVLATGVVSVTNDGDIKVKGNKAYAIKGSGESSILSVTNNKNITVGEETTSASTETGAAVYALMIDRIVNNNMLYIYNPYGYGIYAENGRDNNIIINNDSIYLYGYASTGIYGGSVATIENNGLIESSEARSKGIETYISESETGQTITNKNKINIKNGNNGYGIYSNGNITVNNLKGASIQVGESESYYTNGHGIYAPNAAYIYNAGTININTDDGTGITGSGIISNSGEINTYGNDSYGIYSLSATQVENSGKINVSSGSGIFSSGTVTNTTTGSIEVEDGTGIAVQNADVLDNYGKIRSNSQRAAIYNVGTVNVYEGASIQNIDPYGYAIQNTENVVNHGYISSYGDGIYNSGNLTVENYGDIVVFGDGNGIFNTGSLDVTNNGTISVISGNGNGITSYAANSTNTVNIINNNTIDISGSGNGIFVQIPTSETQVSVINNGYINVVTGKGIVIEKLYGFVESVDSSGKKTYTPSSEKFTLVNSSASYVITCTTGICTLPADAISTSSMDDPAEPVYADDDVSSSLIAVSDNSLLRSVRLVNRGVIATSGNADFGTQSADDAQVYIGDGGSYQADSFTGTIRADSSIVEDGFETTYVNEDSFVGENKGIKVMSQSYLFDADTKENENGNTDVVMTMKRFEDVVDDHGIAEYLSRNYQQQNSEHVFNLLKKAADKTNFSSYLDKELGLDFIPNLMKQSFDVERNISAEINDNLLNIEDTGARFVADVTAYKSTVKSKDVVTGYDDQVIAAHGFSDREIKENLRAGIGLEFFRSNSDYDNKSSRYNNTAAAFLPVIFSKNYLSALIKPKAGFSRGHYRRTGVSENYKADTKEYFYGADLVAEKKFSLDFAEITPSIGMNLTALHTDDIHESNGGLKIKDEDALSSLGVLGIDAGKNFKINNISSFDLSAGAKYFHEFGNRYKNKAQITDTVGYFNIKNNRFERDFGLLKIKAQYNLQQLGVDASVIIPIQEKHKPYYMFNAKYNF